MDSLFLQLSFNFWLLDTHFGKQIYVQVFPIAIILFVE